jgi:hypothetical protein
LENGADGIAAVRSFLDARLTVLLKNCEKGWERLLEDTTRAEPVAWRSEFSGDFRQAGNSFQNVKKSQRIVGFIHVYFWQVE